MNGKHLGWLAGVVLGGAVGLGGVAVAAPAMVYVADEEGNTVTVLDATSFARVARIAVGRGPHNVQVSSDGKLAWVTNEGLPEAIQCPARS